MTLINSCWPNSFSHLIILLSAITTISSSSQNHLYHNRTRRSLETTDSRTAPLVSATTAGGYDHRRRIDNKRYDNLFDFKTDVNNLLFSSHDDSSSTTRTRRKRRDASDENLILNLSNANFTNLNVLNVNISTANVVALNLSHNLLSTLNVSKFYNLTALDLSFNRFSEYQVNGHEHLKALDLSSNLLVRFSCEECGQVEMLNLSRNMLTSIDADNLLNLKFLDLSSNALTRLESTLFRHKSNLSDVILACNRISVINKDLFSFQLQNLRRLDLSHNDISNVVNDAFSELTSLQILDLSFNRIHIASLQTIQNIVQLARLSIAGNVMLKNALRAFAVTWSIMELDYSHVGLCQVPDSLAQSVRILNLYGNFLNIIASGDFESYPFLHKLILSHNNLTSIEEDALGRLDMLTILHLDHNKLTQIPSSLPSSLIELYMHDNLIMELSPNDLMNLINLKVLDLSNNKIIYMPHLTLPSLHRLIVRGCGLENIHHAIMKTSPNLRQLFIDGNLIKCAQLIEIDECYDNDGDADDYTSLMNENIESEATEHKARDHLDSISYFPHDGGYRKCGQSTTSTSRAEVVPNCWNEQKLITSLSRANESLLPTSTNDNKRQHHQKDASLNVSNDKNGSDLSNETMTINKTIVTDGMEHASDEMKNSTSHDDEKAKLASAASVNVVKTEIKALNNNSNDTNNGNKNLSLVSEDAHKQKPKAGGLNNLILMKTKHFKSSQAPNGTALANAIQLSMSNVDYVHTNKSISTAAIINRNLIVDNGKSRKSTATDKVVGVHSTTTNKVNAIKDNGMAQNSNSKSKSIDEVNRLGAADAGKSHYNGPSSNNGNENIEATDHQQQHRAINHTLNGEKSEHWSDIRGGNETTHPGLLIVLASTVGVLFTFIIVYVYRCNFIKNNNSRRRVCRNGSCEHINEGRDALNDNFNNDEEIRSFTIETHNHCMGNVNGGDIITSSTVNHCDLLPMDVLNSSTSQSTVDRSHISMHFW